MGRIYGMRLRPGRVSRAGRRRLIAAVCAVVAVAGSARAQTPVRTPRDSAVRDTLVIRDSTAFRDSIPKVLSDSIITRPVWDMEVLSYEGHSRVEYYVGIFSGRAKETFAKALQRQTRYGTLIGGRLREGGMPEDLTYLALIESWYNPHAYSRAAAVGMWQFMTRTAKGVGMRVDWWVDERRDPVRSTEGAVKLLRELRDQFGSLYLAAAAYNGGDGRVSRGLARYASDLDGVAGEDRFFTLADTKYLRPETRDYVPKMIAAALVGKEPTRYGIKIDSLAPITFDTVRVPGNTSLGAIGNAVGAPISEMKDLNPALIRGMTPLGDSLWVRVPAGAGATFEDRFAALEPDERRGVKFVESKKGETLASIAKRSGIGARQLAWYNPTVAKTKSGVLTTGTRVLVPNTSTVSAAFEVPNPAIERFGRKAQQAARPPTRKGASSAKTGAKAKVATKPGAKKPVAKKPVAPKPMAKKSAARKPAVKKPVSKKPAASRPKSPA